MINITIGGGRKKNLRNQKMKKTKNHFPKKRLLFVASFSVFMFYLTFVAILWLVFKTMWRFEQLDALNDIAIGAFAVFTVIGVCITLAFRWAIMLFVKDTNPDLVDEVKEQFTEETNELIDNKVEDDIR